MEENWHELYSGLQSRITALLRQNPFTLEDVESGYSIALETWIKVRETVKLQPFRSEAEEIHFFSRVKPRFTGQCEFFQLLYQYRLFCPPGKIGTSAFREHEMHKIDRFRDIYGGFFGVYRDSRKDTVLAQQYFLRSTFDSNRRMFSRPYDAHPDYFTNGDWILTQFIGNLRYYRFMVREAREFDRPE